MSRSFGTRCGAALALFASAAVATAQGYVAEEWPDAWTPRPATAQTLGAEMPATVAVPFAMYYFGERLSALTVSRYGWALPGDRAAAPDTPSGADRDGALAVRPGRGAATSTTTWTEGAAPDRKLVVEWVFENGAAAARLMLDETTSRVGVAYDAAPRTGAATGATFAARLDEPDGERVVKALRDTPGAPPRSTVFTPRTVLFNPPGISRQGVPARWLDARRESTVPDGCTKRCTYLARGRGYFHVPDRAALRSGSGDGARWVRQVLDGKIVFLPADGGAPVRVWFRIVEYFSLNARGTTLADHHVWNLRWMLSNAFPRGDPRAEIDGYYAWRAMARGRLTVGKLFAASQTDDAGKQYDSGRKNEYVLWSGRVKHGTRGALAPAASPTEGWVRFTLLEGDMRVTQHAERGDVRFVPDPDYVDGHYEYVVAAPDNAFGWITGRELPPPPLRDEPFDVDPGRSRAPVTPR